MILWTACQKPDRYAVLNDIADELGMEAEITRAKVEFTQQELEMVVRQIFKWAFEHSKLEKLDSEFSARA